MAAENDEQVSFHRLADSWNAKLSGWMDGWRKDDACTIYRSTRLPGFGESITIPTLLLDRAFPRSSLSLSFCERRNFERGVNSSTTPLAKGTFRG